MDRIAYRRHFELDKAHFWRIAKRRLVRQWLDARLPATTDRKILDIGGACSLISRELRNYGDVTVIEPDDECAQLARSELGLNVRRGWLPDDLDVGAPFHLVSLLDVLEHIKDDVTSLHAVRDLLSADGLLICTVPAYQWLWSEHDMALHHFRRYTRSRLKQLLTDAGFRIERISYYTTLLFPVVAVQRLWNRLAGSHDQPSYRIRVPIKAVNTVFGYVMTVERTLLSYVDLPFGASLIAMCSKKK
jgi:2-polyprenyl-3-methyl-5-hydroxy-6-metoxy-1,4-benzoquinol methylase